MASASLDWTFLIHGDILYDRQVEHKRLLQAFQRRLSSNNNRNEFILLSGKSGTGKTALAYTLEKPLASRGGLFVTGKFDQIQSPEPYAALVSAFTEFVHSLLSRDEETIMQVKEAIMTLNESDLGILTGMIPVLKEIVGSRDEKEIILSTRGSQAKTRQEIAFIKFVRAICSPSRPLLLFLDDLQWADPASLELLRLLASNKDFRGLVLVTACRSDELDLDHIFSRFLKNLEKTKQAVITNIVIHNLTPEAVNNMVSDVMSMPKDISRPLAKKVFTKTKGNVFFVKQFMDSLCEDGILFRDHIDGRWVWDNNQLGTMKIKDDTTVLDFVVRKMEFLREDKHTVLASAACIGAEFDENMLVEALPESPVKETLDYALRKVWIVPVSKGLHRFCHDRIQQAAYSLIPETKQDEFHLEFGRKLRKNLSPDDVDKNIFLIVNQMFRGSSLLDDQDEKDDLAELCLRAGRRAGQCSDFENAASNLSFGIQLLSKRKWRDRYYLSLDLYNALIEVEYCNASFDNMEEHIEEVLSNARSFQDEIRAYTTKIYALGSRHRLKEAMDTGLSVLDRLGEPFPSKLSKSTKWLDFAKTKMIVRGKSDEYWLNLPDMCEYNKISAMSILNVVSTYAMMGLQGLFPLVACRMIQLTAKYGLCAISAHAFNIFATVQFSKGSVKEASRFSDLALEVLKKYDARNWLPRVYVFRYGVMGHQREPLCKSLEKLMDGHKVGLATGDIEYSMISAHLLLLNTFFAGKPLDEVQQSAKAMAAIMSSYKQELWLMSMHSTLQTVHNLQGRSDDPIVLTGEAMNEDDHIKLATTKESPILIRNMTAWKVILSYYFKDWKALQKFSLKARQLFEMRKGVVTKNAVLSEEMVFYLCLSCLALAQESINPRHNKSLAKCYIEKMRESVKNCPDNFMNKLCLMEAELSVLKGKLDSALIKYRSSIQLSRTEGFVHEEALACERAGLAVGRFGSEEDGALSADFLKQACKAYRKWGALAKVEQLKREFPFCSND